MNKYENYHIARVFPSHHIYLGECNNPASTRRKKQPGLPTWKGFQQVLEIQDSPIKATWPVMSLMAVGEDHLHVIHFFSCCPCSLSLSLSLSNSFQHCMDRHLWLQYIVAIGLWSATLCYEQHKPTNPLTWVLCLGCPPALHQDSRDSTNDFRSNNYWPGPRFPMNQENQ